MKFGQLILRRIVKIDATKCQILRLKCTKIDFGRGSAPDPVRDIGREGRGRRRRGGEGKEGKEWEGGDPRVYL